MKRWWIFPIVFAAVLVPVAVLASGERGFDGVVRSIESRYHVRATRIPFMGIVSAIARTATQDSFGNIHVAEFENFDGAMDGDELNRMVEEKLGAGWERMIRETSRHGSEQTLIFIHPEGNRMGLFVVDLDGHELDVVQVTVSPDRLAERIGHYEHHHPQPDDDSDESK